MNKKILLPIAGIALLGAAVGAQYSAPRQKFMMVENAISRFYVDTVNEDKLVEDAIRGMLEGLDPHSSYSDPEETKEMNEPLAGNFSGIGISYNMASDTLWVISTVSGGPSEKVGIMPGDRIIAVNDTVIAGVKMKTRDLQKRLRGPKGTDVDVKVLRSVNNRPDTINFTITRADIPIYSVDAAYMVDPATGYIRINRFAADTSKEVREALAKLQKQGMKNLILDLTDNGGGYLNAAVELVSEFLPDESSVVFTEGTNSPRQDLRTHPRKGIPMFGDGRIAVMVNQFSASASEITSGALQDWDRAVIVGRRTFGKGLVQRPIPLPDGSMVRLTIAHYYTPTGRDIQKPYTKGDKEKYGKDLVDRLNSGELMHADSIHYADSLRVYTLNKGRTIYGGGGISPDKFVPLDTTANTKYYRNVMAKGLFNRFVMNYIDKNRKQVLKKYKNDDAFVKNFEITPEMLADLKAMADKEGIEYNAEEAEKSLPLARMQLKALIGRDLFDQATYFKVYNTWDPIFREALRVINSDEYDRLLEPLK